MPDILSGTITVKGLSALEKQLEQFPDRIAKNILSGAIRAGAIVIRDEAKALAPAHAEAHYLGKKGTKSYTLIQPGELKAKGIKIRLAPKKSRSVPIEYWIYVSKRYWYWRFIEFGTSKVTANSFMRPAFDRMKEAATERIREYLAARIEKEAAKRG